MRQTDMYQDKIILAPMVRVCTLPMRLLALDYGADLVYCEEQIDRKLLMCEIKENPLLQTTDFTLSDGTVVFRTCPAEKNKLILQIGTSDAKRALAAAKKIQNYVAGVDVNMGCPKEFSVKGGMGAALLTQPEKVKQILTTLVNELQVPVTCKIRVLPKLEDTIKLAKLIESTGVSALAVHGRTKEERSKDPNRADYIKAVAEAVNIPVIANGDSKNITSLTGVENFKKATGASSVMLARAAMWNCSVFRKQGPLPILEVLKSYLKYAFRYDNNEMNTKYCVLQMLHDRMTELPEADSCLVAKSLQDFANIWTMRAEYEEILQQRNMLERELKDKAGGDCNGVKRRKMDNGSILIELPVRFDKRMYPLTMTPKQILNNWSKKAGFGKPVYTTTERQGDRYYSSTVLFEGKIYTNPHWEKSKQMAEQSAAVACLVANGQDDGRLTEPPNETEELRRKWRNLISSSDTENHSDISATCKSIRVIGSSSEIHSHSADSSVINGQVTDSSVINGQVTDSSVINSQVTDSSVMQDQVTDSLGIHDQVTDSLGMHDQVTDNSVIQDQVTDSLGIHDQVTDNSVMQDQVTDNSVMQDQVTDNFGIQDQVTDNSVINDQVTDNSIISDQLIDYSGIQEQVAES